MALATMRVIGRSVLNVGKQNPHMSEVSVGGEVMETIRHSIEWVALSIEVLAVIVIVAAVIMAALPGGMLRGRGDRDRTDAFSGYKQRMGRGLLLGLELLLAADIIGTVTLRPTLESLAALGLLALVRSFLSWSLAVEIDGCWPWRAKAEERSLANESTSARAPRD